MSNFNMEKDWKDLVIKVGMITLLMVSALFFLPVLYLYFVHGIIPSVSIMLKSWGMIALLCGAFYIVGTYVFFVGEHFQPPDALRCHGS